MGVSYYGTKEWRTLRSSVLAISSSCWVCNVKTGRPHVHHRRGVASRTGTTEDLVVLCPSCHEVVTILSVRRKNFYRIDTNRLIQLVQERVAYP